MDIDIKVEELKADQIIGQNFCLPDKEGRPGIHGWKEQIYKYEWVELPIGAPCQCGQRKYGYCPDCGEHRGTETFSEGVIAYAHGNYEMLCPCCLLKRQIKHAEAMAASLPELRAKFIAAKCER